MKARWIWWRSRCTRCAVTTIIELKAKSHSAELGGSPAVLVTTIIELKVTRYGVIKTTYMFQVTTIIELKVVAVVYIYCAYPPV